MNQRKTFQRPVIRCLLLLLLAVPGRLGWAAATEVVQIELCRDAAIPGPMVTVGDIASVRGGALELRDRMMATDLAEFTEHTSEVVVRRSQVELRLLLAGFDAAQFAVGGASETEITRQPESLRDEVVLEAVRAPLATSWNVEPSNIQARLVRPIPDRVRLDLETSLGYELRPFIPEMSRPGHLSLTMGIYREGQLLETFPVTLEVGLQRRVAVARHDLQPGQMIKADDVIVESRSLTGRTALDATASAVGETVARWIRAGDVLERTDLRSKAATSREGSRPYKVPRRSVVRLVVRRPGLFVTVRAAELLDDAQIGDTVRVRNLTSNKVVTGRLVDASEVEVAF